MFKTYIFWGNYDILNILDIMCPNFGSPSIFNRIIHVVPMENSRICYRKEDGAFSQV
jgi:hypothetical protein